MEESLVSVIIPTRNSERTIETVLESVIKQTCSHYEIIVVDNQSCDRTLSIAKSYQAAVYSQGPERSAQRNYGAAKAKGEYFIFLDSDIELSSRVIEECIQQVRKGFEIITFPEAIIGEGFWAKCRALEAACYLGDDTIEAPRFYSRKIFFALGGFDEALSGTEDWDLRERALKAGQAIGRITALTMHHEGRIDPMDRIRKKIYYARTMRLYMKKNSLVAMRQVPFFRSCYWRKGGLLIKDPVHTLGFVILKAMETLSVMLFIFLRAGSQPGESTIKKTIKEG